MIWTEYLCAPPHQNSYVEILIPNVMILEVQNNYLESNLFVVWGHEDTFDMSV